MRTRLKWASGLTVLVAVVIALVGSGWFAAPAIGSGHRVGRAEIDTLWSDYGAGIPWAEQAAAAGFVPIPPDAPGQVPKLFAYLGKRELIIPEPLEETLRGWARERGSGGLVFAWIDPGYLIAATEITRDQWRFLSGESSYPSGDDRRPVLGLSIDEIERTLERHSMVVPLESEWETAVFPKRGTRFEFGDDATKLRLHGWYLDNSKSGARPVGQLIPNRNGLFDGHGNAAELCRTSETGPYVLRGGSFAAPAGSCDRTSRSRFDRATPRFSGIRPVATFARLGDATSRLLDTLGDFLPLNSSLPEEKVARDQAVRRACEARRELVRRVVGQECGVLLELDKWLRLLPSDPGSLRLGKDVRDEFERFTKEFANSSWRPEDIEKLDSLEDAHKQAVQGIELLFATCLARTLHDRADIRSEPGPVLRLLRSQRYRELFESRSKTIEEAIE